MSTTYRNAMARFLSRINRQIVKAARLTEARGDVVGRGIKELRFTAAHF